MMAFVCGVPLHADFSRVRGERTESPNGTPSKTEGEFPRAGNVVPLPENTSPREKMSCNNTNRMTRERFGRPDVHCSLYIVH